MEAIKTFKEDVNKYRVIISDYTMPEMNGNRFVSEISQYNSRVPFIITTGFGSYKQEEENSEQIKCIMRKPIDIKKLLLNVKSIIG